MSLSRSMRSRGLGLLAAVSVAMIVLPAAHAVAYPRPGRTVLVSLDPRGKQFPKGATQSIPSMPDISSDGRYVSFISYQDVGFQGSRVSMSEIFWRDVARGVTRQASVSPSGLPAVGACVDPAIVTEPVLGSFDTAISGNGRFVAFTSCATNLVGNDTNVKSDIFVWDRNTSAVERVSVASSGAQANGSSLRPAISATGRYVAFSSLASNLVSNDTNREPDVFLHDRTTGNTTRVSLNHRSEQSQGRAACLLEEPLEVGCQTTYIPNPTMSGNARYITWDSGAPDLIANDDNRGLDVFIRDRKLKKTELVSRASDGRLGDKASQLSGIQHGVSSNGRYVIFRSVGTNLVPNTSGVTLLSRNSDIYLRDRTTDRTYRVSVSPAGEEGSNAASYASISPDGRFISFDSSSPYGIPGQNPTPARDNTNVDVFVHDRITGGLAAVSAKPDGSEYGGGVGTACATAHSLSSAIGDGGRYVLFISCNDDMTANDKNNTYDTFRRDFGRQLGTGSLSATGRLAVAGSGAGPASTRVLSATDEAGDIAASADLVGASLAYRPETQDLFVRLDAAQMPHLGPIGRLNGPGILYSMSFSSGGVRYEVRAAAVGSDLLPGGGSIGLFRCETAVTCTKVSVLRGGYGTTGVQVTASVPIDLLGLDAGGAVTDVHAGTALGTYDLGPTEALDRIRL